ncbi:hypothetical protein PMAYCL1PPCAC_24455, partial [Pristionchus mayeri]
KIFQLSIREEDLETIELSDVELDLERALAGISPREKKSTGTGSKSIEPTQGTGLDKDKEGIDEINKEKPIGFLGIVSNLLKVRGR